MNLFNRLFLGAAMAPKQLYRSLGINTAQLKSILQIKLEMDDRRPSALQIGRYQASPSQKVKRTTLVSMFFSLVLGFLFLISFRFSDDPATQLGVYFTFLICMLSLMLIGDFTSVLIDVRDNNIILPKPVNDRTFLASRLLHIMIHMSKVLLPMSLPAWGYIAVQYGVFPSIAFAILVLLAAVFSVFLINTLYVLVLQITSPEKFRNIISYLQILFTVGFYAAVQIMPRMSGEDGLVLEVPDDSWWKISPPFWFGYAFKATVGDLTAAQMLSASMALVGPMLSVWFVVKVMAPNFNRKLAMLSGGGGTPTAAVPIADRSGSVSWLAKIASVVCNGAAEQTGFLFTWKMMLRSRSFA
ncbi:MAG: hypothetical protein IPL65_10690 [Lewinellaceae bacterium]|nr:hypothetical protein [Lewinellaceae bacterium]